MPTTHLINFRFDYSRHGLYAYNNMLTSKKNHGQSFKSQILGSRFHKIVFVCLYSICLLRFKSTFPFRCRHTTPLVPKSRAQFELFTCSILKDKELDSMEVTSSQLARPCCGLLLPVFKTAPEILANSEESNSFCTMLILV